MPTPMKRASLSATPKWLPSTSKATSSIPSGITPSSPVPAKPQVEALISRSLLNGVGRVHIGLDRQSLGRSPPDQLGDHRVALNGSDIVESVVLIKFGESLRGTRPIR